MTAAETLAAFATSLTLEQVPHTVVDTAKLRVLDTVGIALASTKQDFAPSVLAALRALGQRPPAATVVGTRLRAPAAVAALANGALAHGLDFDDTHMASITHASACVVPAALALGEARRLHGRDVLAAAIAGWETITRLGAAAPNAFHARGFHATGVCGAFAATLVAARAMRLAPAAAVSALGVVGSMAAGVFEYLADGSWVKRLHPGWAAHAGLTAAELAAHGFTGPATIFEGRFGFFRTHVGEAWDAGRLTKGLGEEWETLAISFKPYPCCHYNHAFIDASLRLVRDHRIQPEDIERVECRIAAGQVPIVCEPEAAKRVPRTAYDAQFSLPYSVAVALVDGAVQVESFAASRIADPRVLALAQRVVWTVDPESRFPEVFPARVIVTLRNGTRLDAHEPLNRGCAENPMSPDDLKAKFRRNAGHALSPRAVSRLETLIGNMETLEDLNPVMRVCREVHAPRTAR